MPAIVCENCGHTTTPPSDAWAWECEDDGCSKCYVLRDGKWENSHTLLLLSAAAARLAYFMTCVSTYPEHGLNGVHEAHLAVQQWVLLAADRAARDEGVRGIFVWEQAA